MTRILAILGQMSLSTLGADCTVQKVAKSYHRGGGMKYSIMRAELLVSYFQSKNCTKKFEKNVQLT